MPKYDVPMGDPITLIAEECAEVIQIAMKIKRFGLKSYNPNLSLAPNDRLLTQELGDVLAIIDILIDQGYITRENLEVARVEKELRLWNLFGYTRDGLDNKGVVG